MSKNFIDLSVCLMLCLSVSLSVSLSVFLSVCLTVGQSTDLCVFTVCICKLYSLIPLVS